MEYHSELNQTQALLAVRQQHHHCATHINLIIQIHSNLKLPLVQFLDQSGATLCMPLHYQHPALSTYVVIVILNGLSSKVENGPGNDALADKVTDLEVSCQDCLRVLVLKDTEQKCLATFKVTICCVCA